jgi:hypothetical protein
MKHMTTPQQPLHHLRDEQVADLSGTGKQAAWSRWR